MTGRELYEAIGQVDEKYLDMVDTPEMENTNMKQKHFTVRKTITYILAAAICISILTMTAMAAGWFPNIFAAVKPSTKEDADVLEAAIQVTQSQEPETVTVPEIDFTQFTLFERYYDGESVLIGYDLNKVMPETIVGFQPDPQLLAQIKELPRWIQARNPEQTDDNLENMYAQGFITEEAYQGTLDSRTENAKKYGLDKYWQIVMDSQMKEELSAEQYEKFWDILLKDGACCVAIPQKAFVADHIYINGTDCGEVLGPDCGSFRSDYTTDLGECILLNPIPETTRNLNTVDISIRLKSGWHYWYMELDGDVYEKYVPNDAYDATFTLENVNK